MIKIGQLSLEVREDEKILKDMILSKLKINEKNLIGYEIVKKSIDARKGSAKYVYTVHVQVQDEKKVIKGIKNKNITLVQPKKYKHRCLGDIKLNERPVIVGLGPAGLFCGYMLALYGYAPLIIERGSMVDERMKKVSSFWQENTLDTNCNVSFGEGGAGTFSDGKLNTGVKDTFGRVKKVLETFVKFGAPSEILYLNKPHIGTDNLVEVVKNMRNEIIRLGGEVMFDSLVSDINIEDGKVVSIKVNDKIIKTDVLVLAIGHSARDTFSMLKSKNIDMEKKAFAIGLRIEHEREMIDKAMYKEAHKILPAADYKVTHQTKEKRGVYSFCMCPGGYVVNASSEKEMLAINGMSNYKRDAKNSNSALIVTVKPEDFYDSDVLAGVNFQRKWESMAYKEGKGKVPVSLYGDFKNNKISSSFGKITPNIKGEYHFGNLNDCLPKYVSSSIKEGIEVFATKIQGFNDEEAILSGVETRTSSPVRIVRNDELESNIGGLYPCGEGAGYAGGITSAAIDGIKVFEAITKKYKKYN